MRAAEASECAAEQGRFWEYHHKLFASQAGEGRGAFARDRLKRFAADLGLNSATFNACLDSGRYAQKVRNDTAEGRARGVRATPTFFINTTKVEGAQTFAVFQGIIEDELKRRR